MTDIVITVHGSGIEGEPLHLRGEGSENCLICHPRLYPAVLSSPHGHTEIAAAVDLDALNIKRLGERISVVEQVLSDLIALQPGEPGYEEPT
jgi:hypothetical protein